MSPSKPRSAQSRSYPPKTHCPPIESSTEFSLSGKHALIIGGSSGMGGAIAESFVAAGADVTLSARRLSRLRQAAKSIASGTGTTPAIHVSDVTDPSSLTRLRKAFLKNHPSIDILVCSAGIHLKKPFLKMNSQEWKQILDVNLTGTYHVNRIMGEVMVKKGSGSILNFSSLGARQALSEASAYCVSKSGVEMLTRCLAVEWADHGVRVNTILPGVFQTPLNKKALAQTARREKILQGTPLKRFGNLKEITGAAIYLASDASQFVTGTSVIVDGGFLASSGF